MLTTYLKSLKGVKAINQKLEAAKNMKDRISTSSGEATLAGDNGYERNNDEEVPVGDERFVDRNIPFKTVATSSAQNDRTAASSN